MTIFLEIEQRTQSWHEFRKGKIGASYASIIMGMSPWKTPLQLYNDIINDRETPVNRAMQRGIDKESEALEWINANLDRSGIDTFVPIVAQSLECPWLIASLDGWDGEMALEIKVPGETAHLQALAGNIPDYYYPQLQHIMLVTKTEKCFYCSYNEKGSVILQCYADHNYQEELMAKLHLFYTRIISREEPPASEKDVRMENCPEALASAMDYEEICINIERLEQIRETIKKNLLRYALKDKNIIGNLSVTKCVRQGNIQYNKIPGLDLKECEKYRGEPVEYFKISRGEKNED